MKQNLAYAISLQYDFVLGLRLYHTIHKYISTLVLWGLALHPLWVTNQLYCFWVVPGGHVWNEGAI